jgi:hypothetical protein
LNGDQIEFEEEFRFKFKLNLKKQVPLQWFEEKTQRPQIQQESRSRSSDRDASHAVWEAPGEKPQAGYCNWPFQGAAKGRKGAPEKGRVAHVI